MESGHSLKWKEMGDVLFSLVKCLVVDSFRKWEGFSRMAFLEGKCAVMVGKIVSLVF